jgi:hypothetical protein
MTDLARPAGRTLAVILVVACNPTPAGRPPPVDPTSSANPPAPAASPEVPKSAPPPPGKVCGLLPGEPPVRREWPWKIGDVARCERAANTWANVRHQDRACAKDEECVAVSADGGCFLDALHRSAAALPRYAEMPCTSPAAGPCRDPRAARAVCDSGCCTPLR